MMESFHSLTNPKKKAFSLFRILCRILTFIAAEAMTILEGKDRKLEIVCNTDIYSMPILT
jgi:hypothetical protein